MGWVVGVFTPLQHPTPIYFDEVGCAKTLRVSLGGGGGRVTGFRVGLRIKGPIDRLFLLLFFVSAGALAEGALVIVISDALAGEQGL